MNIAHFESGVFPPETARAQSGKAALVLKLGQRVHLVHELRKLG